jgi:hypothetical protein
MYITVDGDVSVVGTGSEPVYCTGPFAGNNVHLSSNTGKMLYISSSIIVMYDLTVGSDGGAPVTIKNIVEVGVDAGNPLCLLALLHKLHKSTHYRLTRPNHLTLALSLPPSQIGGNATRYYTNGDTKITMFAVFGNWVDVRTTGPCGGLPQRRRLRDVCGFVRCRCTHAALSCPRFFCR